MWINRHKNLATAVLVFFGSVLLVFVALIPIYKNATDLLGKIEIRSGELDSMMNKVSILSKIDPNVLKDRVVVLDKALPPTKDILLYLNSIEGLSKELGLTFGGLSLSPGEISEASASAKVATAPKKKTLAKTTAGLDSLDTEIKMRGNQDSIYTFLRTIEEVLPLMQIKDIKVNVLTQDQFSLTLTLGMLWADPVVVNINGPVTLFGAEEDKYFTQLAGYRSFSSVPIEPLQTDGNKADIFSPFELPSINVIEPSTTEIGTASGVTN